MSAGDVLLFHRPSANLFTILIRWSTKSRFNHAAMDIGDGMMVEALSSGVSVNPISGSRDQITVAVPVYVGNDLEDVLAWATGRVGWRYGWGNALWCGLRNMFPGIVSIKHGRSIICSELVAEALARAGYDFDKDYALVSPGDLAEHLGVPRQSGLGA